MKLSKRAWAFLAVGIFFILAVSLGVAYLQQNSERSRLEEELSLAQLRLDKSPPSEGLSLQVEDLESKLSQAEVQLEDTKSHLIQPIENIEIADTLYKDAEPYHIEIIEISSPGLGAERRKELPALFCRLPLLLKEKYPT